ncbi:hypothetical protein CROQUDRAFT_91347 [Cronartium quercuum f. sp. fusiforme G11]|uniref:Uncharacterized protein n=1 Tax=Cronartium quercuum f. sp. fusiforme G11 TaxID=708437 RepID=A0A9P6TCK3_9BASI|nr:hypothetical protein CROQUDRAFT_91347 [Cronartium quercuum f. sp. fusiforme G11]
MLIQDGLQCYHPNHTSLQTDSFPKPNYSWERNTIVYFSLTDGVGLPIWWAELEQEL